MSAPAADLDAANAGPPQHTVVMGQVVMGDSQLYSYVLQSIGGLGKPETTAGDKPRPREDGEYFGRDRLRGRLITIKGYVNTGGGGDARAAWRRLMAAWDPTDIRETPGAVAPMQLGVFDSPVATVYGRPRNLDPRGEDEETAALWVRGCIPFIATFQCGDNLFYGPEQSATVPIVTAASSGLTWPSTWPLRWTSRVASRAGQIDVGGDTAAYLQTTVFGPVARPTVEVVDHFALELDLAQVGMPGGLPADRYISVIASPWARSVLLDGTTNVAGALTPASRLLKNARLPPGPQEVVLRGQDPTGTASMAISWRDASRSL